MRPLVYVGLELYIPERVCVCVRVSAPDRVLWGVRKYENRLNLAGVL